MSVPLQSIMDLLARGILRGKGSTLNPHETLLVSRYLRSCKGVADPLKTKGYKQGAEIIDLRREVKKVTKDAAVEREEALCNKDLIITILFNLIAEIPEMREHEYWLENVITRSNRIKKQWENKGKGN